VIKISPHLENITQKKKFLEKETKTQLSYPYHVTWHGGFDLTFLFIGFHLYFIFIYREK
jgi:hypothetical protein